jgi:hypothetical protein
VSFHCLKFGSGSPLTLTPTAGSGDTSAASLPSAFLVVTLSDSNGVALFTQTFAAGIYVTRGNDLLGLAMKNAGEDARTLIFFACGQLATTVPILDKKRSNIPNTLALATISAGAATLAGSGNGDPHFTGANGVKFDFNGEPNGDYSSCSRRRSCRSTCIWQATDLRSGS